MSLRLRLLVVSLALVAAGLTLAGLVTYRSLSSFLHDRTDMDLDTAASSARHMVTDLPAGVDVDRQMLAASAPGIWVRLDHASGGAPTIAQGYAWISRPLTPRLPASMPPLSGGGYLGPVARFTTRANENDSEFRVLVATTARNDTIVLAASQRDTENTLGRLLLVEVIAGGVILAVAAISGMWLMRLGLRPLARIEHAAEHIAEDNIGERLPGERSKTEVGRLARVLNTMLMRLETSFAERRATEERLRASEERLRRFAADASHELRTPIASVRAYAELYRRRRSGARDAVDVGADEVIAKIEQESMRLGRLVDDLLLLARLDEGQPLSTQPVDLGALADSAIDSARLLDPTRTFELIVAGSVEVLGDRDRLRQVIDNLLANVIAHTPPGSPALVSVAAQGDHAVLVVADRGAGLSDVDRDRIFERFYRADPSRTRRSGGSGLGMSILDSIVVAHGGRVAVEARRGGGTLLRVELPLLVEQPAARAAAGNFEASQVAHRNSADHHPTPPGGDDDPVRAPSTIDSPHP